MYINRNLSILQNIYLNLEVRDNTKLMEQTKRDIREINRKLRKDKIVKIYTKNIGEIEGFIPIPIEFNGVSIDLEGFNPLKLLGMLIQDTIHFYMLKLPYIKEFYEILTQILRIIKDVFIFGFSFWDLDALLNVRENLIYNFGISRNNLAFFDKLKYYNLQDYDKESVIAALYSLKEDIPKDPLYRNGRKINNLYDDGFHDIILKHNQSCLHANSIILQKRFLKKNLIKLPRKITDKEEIFNI